MTAEKTEVAGKVARMPGVDRQATTGFVSAGLDAQRRSGQNGS